MLHIEAIIFASTQPVTIIELCNCFAQMDEMEIEEFEVKDALKRIAKKFKGADSSFELVQKGGGYQFLTKAAYHETVALFLNQKSKKKLSTAAMETLSIIAYKQPVTKSEIEQIRGVNADYTIHKLLEKELVSVLGKAETPGRPILYGVSPFFLDYFGINSTEELPKLKEIAPPEENTVGEAE